MSALHAKHNTTNLFGYNLGESTENNKALFSQVWKQFKLLTVPLVVREMGSLAQSSNFQNNIKATNKIPEYARDFRKEWLSIRGINKECRGL